VVLSGVGNQAQTANEVEIGLVAGLSTSLRAAGVRESYFLSNCWRVMAELLSAF
jgi:hypothetical protein